MVLPCRKKVFQHWFSVDLIEDKLEKEKGNTMGLFSKLKEGLTKTRNNIVASIDSIFSGFSSIDDMNFMKNLKKR